MSLQMNVFFGPEEEEIEILSTEISDRLDFAARMLINLIILKLLLFK